MEEVSKVLLVVVVVVVAVYITRLSISQTTQCLMIG